MEMKEYACKLYDTIAAATAFTATTKDGYVHFKRLRRFEVMEILDFCLTYGLDFDINRSDSGVIVQIWKPSERE